MLVASPPGHSTHELAAVRAGAVADDRHLTPRLARSRWRFDEPARTSPVATAAPASKALPLCLQHGPCPAAEASQWVDATHAKGARQLPGLVGELLPQRPRSYSDPNVINCAPHCTYALHAVDSRDIRTSSSAPSRGTPQNQSGWSRPLLLESPFTGTIPAVSNRGHSRARASPSRELRQSPGKVPGRADTNPRCRAPSGTCSGCRGA